MQRVTRISARRVGRARRRRLGLVEPVVLGLCTIGVAIAGEPRPLALVAAAAGAITTVTSLTHRQKGNNP